ncbi:hypothetical protein KC968_03055 [Candidatus Saccharibacteria bacterium]|nr:hypothetical protein [Candidatus Saccharibacteria bacterium]
MSETLPIFSEPSDEFNRWHADGTERFPGVNTYFPDPSEYFGDDVGEVTVQSDELETKE